MDAEQLAQIEELAALQFSMEEVAVIVDVPAAALAEGEPMRAYLRGRLKAQAEVRRSIVSMAKQGSSPATAARRRDKWSFAAGSRAPCAASRTPGPTA